MNIDPKLMAEVAARVRADLASGRTSKDVLVDLIESTKREKEIAKEEKSAVIEQSEKSRIAQGQTRKSGSRRDNMGHK